MNSTVYDYAPQIPARIRERGDEFIGHGRSNSERQSDLDEEAEGALIDEVTEAFRRHEGASAGGWMGPWISESQHTPDLLAEAGYRYVMDWPFDDQPVWMRTRAGKLLSIPYHIEINDSPAQLTRRHSVEEFTAMVIAHFDEMLRQCRTQPLVFSLPLHTFVVGQPFRLAGLRTILEYIAHHPESERIWLTRPGEIYDHISRLPKGTVPGSASP